MGANHACWVLPLCYSGIRIPDSRHSRDENIGRKTPEAFSPVYASVAQWDGMGGMGVRHFCTEMSHDLQVAGSRPARCRMCPDPCLVQKARTLNRARCRTTARVAWPRHGTALCFCRGHMTHGHETIHGFPW